jgi:heptose I phosphotransferase
LFLRSDIAALWGDDDPFERVVAWQGETYRAVATRRTQRVVAGGRAYFSKIHWGVGWAEIVKNLVTLRLPVIGARNEFEACRHLAQAGVPAPTVAAFGERGVNPAQRFSFVVCDALEGRESLEDLAARWHTALPTATDKRCLVRAVAHFARALHGAGVVHRDFYICHLLLDREAWAQGRAALAVIDLHRAQIRQNIPRRWLRRDLAALLFSVLELPLSRRDWLRFLCAYRGQPLRHILVQEGAFWAGVERRALALYRKGRRKGLVAGSYQPGRADR